MVVGPSGGARGCGDGVELVLARDIAAVRDLVRLREGEETIRSFATVHEAVEALSAQATSAR